ncbi:MAG: primosomal protein N', partial [Gammaproteobacteria bacterium]|nr:primosomal protein N' [Gammaproteobacteria bacterium]
MTSAPPVLRVALDTPLRRLFDYLAPPGAAPPPGTRVQVPFGRQRLVGVVMGSAAASELPAERLKPVLAVLDTSPVLDGQLLELLRWTASYYHHPIGQVIAAALPRALREGAATLAREERWQLTAAGRSALAEPGKRRGPRQAALLAHLAAGDATAAGLDAGLPNWRPTARELAARGWVERQEVTLVPQPVPARARAPGLQLSDAQGQAVQRIGAALDRYGAYLLHGITGSGKTEVYLRLIEQVLAAGRRALLLVPEIGLTPQLLARVAARFDTPLAVLHSALTDQERLAAWRRAHSGEAHLVLGTRSAVFAPVPQLGLIVIDEEHDTSFKQHEGAMRYSARDLAVVRAHAAGVPVVLGSATPSLETLQNVAAGRYLRLAMPERAGAARPPRLALIDLRSSALRHGLATEAVLAIERHLNADAQVLVFLNRRGYAPTLLCTACGWIAPCRECDARLTVHQAAGRLRCHHCGADAPLPERCPQCGFAVKPVGQGTERIEQTLAGLFPKVSIARLDRDVARRRGEAQSVVARMASGEARILVGTQMITKGHDFPDVTLVLVLNADQGLFSTDFRAPERLAQTIVQVAGRAGRGARAGEVLIQTEYPEHPLLQHLLQEGYEGFSRAALAERAEAAWPPFARLAALRASARTAEAALAFLRAARARAEPAPRGVKLLGPVPAAMAKRAGRYHAQLLIESGERARLQGLLERW